MPKIFAIVTMQGGAPNINFAATPVKGFLHCGTIGQFGAYIFSGTASQLVAIDALPNVVALAVMNENFPIRWPELDNVITTAHRTRINTWLTARGFTNIPAGWTYRQVVLAVWRRFFPGFEIERNDVAE